MKKVEKNSLYEISNKLFVISHKFFYDIAKN